MSDDLPFANRFDKRYVSFADQPGGPPPAPYNWPQEVLKVPDGFGGVPIINDLNANLALREPFGMVAHFPRTNAYELVTLQVPADGDFWLDSLSWILPQGFTDNPEANPHDITPSLFQVTDVGTGYKFFPSGPTWSGANIGAFNCYQLGAFRPVPGQPNGAGQRTSMIQPYCFLRSTSIEIEVTGVASGGQLGYYFHMAGWKEYSYAAG
jgi:hypothetical protein